MLAFENTATPSTGGSGTGVTVLAVTVRSSGSGKLVAPGALALSVTTQPAGCAAATYTDIALTGGTGQVQEQLQLLY